MTTALNDGSGLPERQNPLSHPVDPSSGYNSVLQAIQALASLPDQPENTDWVYLNYVDFETLRAIVPVTDETAGLRWLIGQALEQPPCFCFKLWCPGYDLQHLQRFVRDLPSGLLTKLVK